MLRVIGAAGVLEPCADALGRSGDSSVGRIVGESQRGIFANPEASAASTSPTRRRMPAKLEIPLF
jgi:hypothetical protein